jgi:hypothetical protein
MDWHNLSVFCKSRGREGESRLSELEGRLKKVNRRGEKMSFCRNLKK